MKKILVIDDEPLIRTYLKATLERAGYTVEEASNGEEGLRKFYTFAPQLIITDIVMPDKDGIELIREIRKTDNATKFIAISGGGYIEAEKYLTLAQALDIETCLKKPLHTKELLAAVSELLGAEP